MALNPIVSRVVCEPISVCKAHVLDVLYPLTVKSVYTPGSEHYLPFIDDSGVTSYLSTFDDASDVTPAPIVGIISVGVTDRPCL